MRFPEVLIFFIR
jgi:hypothetical protein